MNLDNTPGDDFGRVADDAGTALVPVAASVPPVEALISKAIEHNVSVETMEKLLAMRERLKAEQARETFFEALSAFQADCPVIRKDKKVLNRDGSERYRYAALEDIMQAITPILRRHGLSVRFDAQFETSPPAQLVACIVNHRDGHSERSEFRAPTESGAPGMNVMQMAASALTYGRRYALLNALGLVVGGEDDDGAGGGGTTRQRAAPVPSSTSMAGQAGGATPRPLGRNLVKIPRPAQEPQGSDGSPSRATRDDPPVAETPAAPERDANDEAKAELRKDIIEKQMLLLREMKRYRETPQDELWDRAAEVASATALMHFNKPLHEMSRWDLERMAVKMAQVVEEKVGQTA